MKKAMMTMMTVAVMLNGAMAMAAPTTQERNCWDNRPCYETNYDCGRREHGRHHQRGYYQEKHCDEERNEN